MVIIFIVIVVVLFFIVDITLLLFEKSDIELEKIKEENEELNLMLEDKREG